MELASIFPTVFVPERTAGVESSGSLAAAIMKNGATDRIPALDWAQRHGLPSSNVKITRNSGRIRGAACNDQIKRECITVFHGR
jgi:hypothetical protein